MNKLVYRKSIWEKLALQFPILQKMYTKGVIALRKILSKEKPDFMVIDILANDALDVAEEMQIPYVIVSDGYLSLSGYPFNNVDGMSIQDQTFMNRLYSSTIGFFKMMRTAMPNANALNADREKLGLQPVYNPFEKVTNHVMIATSCFGFEYTPVAIPPNLKLVGGIVPKFDPSELSTKDKELITWMDKLGKDEKIVYIAFGSAAAIQEFQLQRLLDGASKLKNVHILLAIRKPVLDEMKHLRTPKNNIRIENWVNQRMVLRHKNVKVFVTHSGIQSIFESMEAGVPLLALPFFGDQMGNSAKVLDSGIGLRLDPLEFTEQDVYNNLNILLTNWTQFSQRMKHLQKINERMGGAIKAADIIEEAIELGWDHLIPIAYNTSWIVTNNYDVKLFLLFIGSLFLLTLWRFITKCCCKVKPSISTNKKEKKI